jgi:hypothetical protein
MKAQLCIRSQHSVGASKGFGGPDTYVAVIWCANDAVAMPYVLRQDVLAHRGISYQYVGEGYSQHRGPKSMLGRAIAAAKAFIAALREGSSNECKSTSL